MRGADRWNACYPSSQRSAHRPQDRILLRGKLLLGGRPLTRPQARLHTALFPRPRAQSCAAHVEGPARLGDLPGGQCGLLGTCIGVRVKSYMRVEKSFDVVQKRYGCSRLDGYRSDGLVQHQDVFSVHPTCGKDDSHRHGREACQ